MIIQAYISENELPSFLETLISLEQFQQEKKFFPDPQIIPNNIFATILSRNEGCNSPLFDYYHHQTYPLLSLSNMSMMCQLYMSYRRRKSNMCTVIPFPQLGSIIKYLYITTDFPRYESDWYGIHHIPSWSYMPCIYFTCMYLHCHAHVLYVCCHSTCIFNCTYMSFILYSQEVFSGLIVCQM